MAAPPLVQMTSIPGRGRSLISTRDILPGEVILTDSPLLVYPSSSSSSEDPSSFLSAAHSLSLSSPSLFSSLLSLSPSSIPPPPSIPSPFPPSLTASLLSIDRANAFALTDSHRQVHSCAIYPLASFFNHDCLPNAARFDTPQSPNLTIRAIHRIPSGREVCLSYFPVNWQYKDRQTRLEEVYGFRCGCDRCRVEVNWKDDGNDDDDQEMAMEYDGDFPHAYFFVRYLCDEEECGGTLAPLPPENGVVSDVLECNVCGKTRKEEEEEDVGSDDGDMVD